MLPSVSASAVRSAPVKNGASGQTAALVLAARSWLSSESGDEWQDVAGGH